MICSFSWPLNVLGLATLKIRLISFHCHAALKVYFPALKKTTTTCCIFSGKLRSIGRLHIFFLSLEFSGISNKRRTHGQSVIYFKVPQILDVMFFLSSSVIFVQGVTLCHVVRLLSLPLWYALSCPSVRHSLKTKEYFDLLFFPHHDNLKEHYVFVSSTARLEVYYLVHICSQSSFRRS